MMLDDVIDIKKPDPDSHFKLLPCKKCQSDDVAYVHYNGRGGAKWRVECFNCGHTVDKGNTVRHDAQLACNKDVKANE